MSLIWALLGWVAALLAGYAIGRRVGRAQGREEGKAITPIELRERAYLTGSCPICAGESRWREASWDNLTTWLQL